MSVTDSLGPMCVSSLWDGVPGWESGGQVSPHPMGQPGEPAPWSVTGVRNAERHLAWRPSLLAFPPLPVTKRPWGRGL